MRLAVAGALLLLVGCTQPAENLPAGADGRVVRVIDGDTVDVRLVKNGRASTERIRLIGIDTPETKKPHTPVQCFGPEASARTAQLLPPGTLVVVRADSELRDDYGRLLAYVHRFSDGVFVNRQLLDEGLARTLEIPPNTGHADEFRRSEAAARRAARGLWGRCTDSVAP